MISGGLRWEVDTNFSAEYMDVLSRLKGNYPECELGDIRRVVYEMLATEYALQAICVVDITEENFMEVYSNRVYKCLMDNQERASGGNGDHAKILKRQLLELIEKVKVGNQTFEKYISFKLAAHMIVSGHMKIQRVSGIHDEKQFVAIVINGLNKATDILKDYVKYPFELECVYYSVESDPWMTAISKLRQVQTEFFPAISSVNFLFPNSFVLNKSGNHEACSSSFVWHNQGPRYKFLMVAESNGFLRQGIGWKTIIHSELQRAFLQQEITNPGYVLQRVIGYLSDFHRQIFSSPFDAEEFNFILIVEDTYAKEISLACLNNSLYQVTRFADLRKHPVQDIHGDIYTTKIPVSCNDKFYILPSLGTEDNDGKTKNILLELLRSTSALHLKDQEFILRRSMETLRMDSNKCVIGLGF